MPTEPISDKLPEKALLVGLNDYVNVTKLSGCVNDVESMAEMVVKKFNFAEENMRLLVDSRATTSTIMERLNWLVDVPAGGRCFFHYSGHGTQTASRGNDGEVDGQCEAICPFDFDWSAERMITDKQLVQVFSKIPEGVRFYWFSDSCHSGDLDRGLVRRGKKKARPDVPRYVAPPADLAWRLRVANKMNIAKRALVNGGLDSGFISACRSDQTASDTYIDGRNCGAFTHYLEKNLRANPGMTMSQLLSAVTQDLASNGYDQRPTLSGTKSDKPFLG